ncbi:MAG: YraN family protein [Atopobiaceae bacterium]|nr:YraN family protein [Atopobiaceae bacterium]
MVSIQEVAGMPHARDGMFDVRLRCVETGIDKSVFDCSPKEIGDFGEDVAASYLEQRGLEIIDRKWRCVFGEADIVARDQGELVLVEVKTRLARSKEDDLAPEVAVGQRKLNRYERMALMYYAEQASSGSIRFDVIALKLLNDHNVMLRHFLSAYAWDR